MKGNLRIDFVQKPHSEKCTRALFPVPGWCHSVVGYFWHWDEYEYEEHTRPSFFETKAGPEYLVPSGFPWVKDGGLFSLLT